MKDDYEYPVCVICNKKNAAEGRSQCEDCDEKIDKEMTEAALPLQKFLKKYEEKLNLSIDDYIHVDGYSVQMFKLERIKNFTR